MYASEIKGDIVGFIMYNEDFYNDRVENTEHVKISLRKDDDVEALSKQVQ